MAKDDKVEQILRHAARLFAQRSYAATSIRDIAGEAQISLAGLYYYFKSKEEVLFTIQKSIFDYVLDSLRPQLADVPDPTEGLRILIRNHIRYFVDHMDAMKVLSHESETLNDRYYERIAETKREYFKILVGIIERILGPDADPSLARTYAMSLFGMMNWIYNWYNPKHDPEPDELARRMAEVFLHGIAREA